MDWSEQNDTYLSLSLAWLRARLGHFIDAGESSGGAGVSSPGGDRAEEAMREASEFSPPPSPVMLGRRLGLTEFERNVLLLCAGMELDTRVAALCARAQGDAAWPYPTFALALALFDSPHWDALAPHRPLRQWRLVEVNQSPVQPLTVSALKIDERILNYIKGLNHIDARLAPLLTGMRDDSARLSSSQRAVVDRLVSSAWLATAEQTGGGIQVIQLLGHDGESKRAVALGVAGRLGVFLYRLPAGALPAQPHDLDALVRLWERERALLPIALYIDAQETDQVPGSDGLLSPLTRFLERSGGVVFVGARDALPLLAESSTYVDVGRPTPAEQREAWARAVPDDPGQAAQIAGQFDLSLGAIHRLAHLHEGSEDHRLWDACSGAVRPHLDTLAQRIDAKATWEDLVLPPEEMALLRAVAGQVRQRGRVYDSWGFHRRMNRGLGITALFAGESGTGKTMAAEVIANDLRLGLYRIDLSAVVNKYIGETEKNLRRLFDAAEGGGAILFFDEADALFGKRSEVKDSHDRYANIEINYLLQRMEAYRGLAILATNMRSALDPAFLRRIRFVVNFPFPSHTERGLMWRKVFPAETPVERLEYERLARWNLTGGNIHAIALNAAFLAAEEGAPVSMPLVLAAARAEFRKLDRPINEAEFR